jgi:hypothetical protein
MKIPVLNSHYIKKWADETQKTYRELQALWKRTASEVEYDRMMDPNKYTNLRGDLSQEIQRRFEDELTKGPEMAEEEMTAEMTVPVEEEFGMETEESLEAGPEEIPSEVDEFSDIDSLFEPMEEMPVEEGGEEIIEEEIPEGELPPEEEVSMEDMFAVEGEEIPKEK